MMISNKVESKDSTPASGNVVGVAIEALPNAMFRVKYNHEGEDKEGIAYLAGRMRIHRIRVMVGDQVEIVLDPYGGKGRIVKRL